MTARQARAAAAEPRLVLICQGCRYAFEPLAPEWTAEHLRAMAQGCPECGDWLYLGDLTHPDPTPDPRRART